MRSGHEKSRGANPGLSCDSQGLTASVRIGNYKRDTSYPVVFGQEVVSQLERLSMTDKAQTPEAIAYNLMHDVMVSDKRDAKDREYILSTYEECLKAAKGHSRKPSSDHRIRAV